MKHRVEITHNFSLEQCMRCHKRVGCQIFAPDIQMQDGQDCAVERMAADPAAAGEGQNSSTVADPNARREQDI